MKAFPKIKIAKIENGMIYPVVGDPFRPKMGDSYLSRYNPSAGGYYCIFSGASHYEFYLPAEIVEDEAPVVDADTIATVSVDVPNVETDTLSVDAVDDLNVKEGDYADDTPLEETHLSKKVVNRMKKGGFATVGDFRQAAIEAEGQGKSLEDLPGIGAASVEEAKTIL